VGGVKTKRSTENKPVKDSDHLRATRLRSRPSSISTSMGSLSGNGKTTGGTAALFEPFKLLVLLVRRLEDVVWEGIVGDVAVVESIIIMTACLRLAPADRGSIWFGMLEKVKGPGVLSVGTGSTVETV